MVVVIVAAIIAKPQLYYTYSAPHQTIGAFPFVMHTHTNAHVYSCRAVSIACVIDRVRRSLRMRQDHTLAGLVARCIVYVRKSVCNFIIHKNTTDMFITFLQYRLIMALY